MKNPKLFDAAFTAPEHSVTDTHLETDITLRDLFAASALGGVLNNNSLLSLVPKDISMSEWASRNAYIYADAMLEERRKKERKK